MIIEKKKVLYDGKFYYVCKYLHNDEERLFVIDWEDGVKMFEASDSWYQINGYIGFKRGENYTITTYYLHNIIAEKPQGGGKGQKFTIDHINRNPLDNRKANLRLITQTQQNENQGRRSRQVKLPEGCGIKLEDIPKCVYYSKPSGNHGERFILELKANGQRKMYKSTSSKSVSLMDKLIEIKKIILDLSKTHPELLENKSIIENYTDQQIKLIKDFNAIIEKSGFECAADNMMKVPKKKVLKSNTADASHDMRNYLQNTNTAVKRGRRHNNNLPKGCGITVDMIPKHCYYRKATSKRGDAFVIDRHPLLPEGVRQWVTSGATKVTTEQKFAQLQKKLKQLRKGNVDNSDSSDEEPDEPEESDEEDQEESDQDDESNNDESAEDSEEEYASEASSDSVEIPKSKKKNQRKIAVQVVVDDDSTSCDASEETAAVQLHKKSKKKIATERREVTRRRMRRFVEEEDEPEKVIVKKSGKNSKSSNLKKKSHKVIEI